MVVTKVTYYCYDIGIKGQGQLYLEYVLLLYESLFFDREASYFANMSLRQGQIYKIRVFGFKRQLLLLVWAEDIHILHNVCLVKRTYLCSRK